MTPKLNLKMAFIVKQTISHQIVLFAGFDAFYKLHCLRQCFGLVHVARKMSKNAHVHFVLGLMYQRLGQPLKAVTAFEKSSEILKQSEEEIGQSRRQLLSLVQIHHAQCLLQGNIGDHCSSDKELQQEEIVDIVCKLKESVQADDRQASVWNTLGLLLLRTGRVQVSAISVLSSLLSVVPDYLDALANLGVAYLHRRSHWLMRQVGEYRRWNRVKNENVNAQDAIYWFGFPDQANLSTVP
eukprot:Gb_38525 [translate_table: standard]